MLSQHNLAVAAELFTEDFVEHAAESPQGRLSGIAGVKQEVGGYLQAFPDMRVTIEDSIAEGDHVAIRGVLTGTQRGELAGIPATGKPVTVPVQQAFRLKDGKIAEAWLALDRPGILHQLGAIPAPAAQPEDYIVREGDTLSGIAAHFGTTVEALRQANPLTDPNQIEIGRRLVIPR